MSEMTLIETDNSPLASVLDFRTGEQVPWALTNDEPTTFVVLAGTSVDTDNHMHPVDLAEYRENLLEAVYSAGGSLFARAIGEGEWANQTEGVIILAGTVPPNRTDHLATFLRWVADAYKQESIGLVIHNHTLYGKSYV